MFDPNPPDFTGHGAPVGLEGPNLHPFVARHQAFFILVGVLVAQFLLLSFQITRNHNVRLIRFWAVAVFDPMERSLRGMAGASTRAWRTYRGLWNTQQENQELHAQLVAATIRIHELSEQAAELPRLRELLEFKNHLAYNTLAAQVIATSPGESFDAFFIDKGADSGLTTDLAVITPEGLVGKTIAVFSRTAQVLLLTDPSSGLGAMLARSRIQGVLKGSGRSLCKLHYIMNEETVSVGDAVLSSGLDQICPKGLPLGTVVRVEEGNIYKTITVKPVAPLNRLEGVLVVLKPALSQQQALSLPPNH